MRNPSGNSKTGENHETRSSSLKRSARRAARWRRRHQNDLEIQATKGSGPGGQNKNKSKNMIRMKHIPTGFVACVDGRDYQQNRKKALRVLTARVNAKFADQKQSKYDRNRCNQLGGGGRSNKVRTYNFIKQRVVDHNLNAKTRQIDEIMKGRFELILPRENV